MSREDNVLKLLGPESVDSHSLGISSGIPAQWGPTGSGADVTHPFSWANADMSWSHWNLLWPEHGCQLYINMYWKVFTFNDLLFSPEYF